MKIYKTTSLDDSLWYVNMCLAEKSGQDSLIVNIADSIFVEAGKLPSTNIRECKLRNIPVGKAEYIGGSIVTFPGDLNLCLITFGKRFPHFGEDCMEVVTKLLQDAGASVIRDRNDVLADGKKVASWGRGTLISGWVQTVVHFSVNVDVPLIQQICTKEMIKQPGALSEYGITAEELLERLGFDDNNSKWEADSNEHF